MMDSYVLSYVTFTATLGSDGQGHCSYNNITDMENSGKEKKGGREKSKSHRQLGANLGLQGRSRDP